MKISAVVCSLINKPDKMNTIKRCVKSLIGADEVIVFAPTDYNLGFCKSWNFASELATGDYLVFIGDNNIQIAGSLGDLAIEDTVTSPLINGNAQEFWGFVFCVPRNIYKKYGLYDLVYNEGVHFMDNDLWKRYLKEGVSLKSVNSVNFSHPEGGQTVNSTPDFQEKMQRNVDIFNERWGK